MDNIIKKTLVSDIVIDDFISVLERKGFSGDEINDTLVQLIAEVELNIVEELMDRLSDDRKAVLDALVAQDASRDEIIKQLELNEDDLDELEMQKFEELSKNFSKFLPSSQ